MRSVCESCGMKGRSAIRLAVGAALLVGHAVHHWNIVGAADRDTEPGQEQTDPPVEVLFEDTIDTGFVILDAMPLPSPYHIQATTNSVTVNDRVVRQFDGASLADRGLPADSDSAVGPAPPPRRRGPYGGFWGRGRFSPGARPENNPRWVAAILARQLRQETVVVYSRGELLTILASSDLQANLFRAALSQNHDSEATKLFLESRATSEHEEWSNWISDFTVTDEFRLRAEAVIAEYDEITERNFAEVRANRRLHSFGYPLTILGMVLGVVGLGHLLKSFPCFTRSTADEETSPEVARAVFISVALIAVLSLFDLVWTILVSQAGQMSELNPIGSRLIKDPNQLVIFKLLATLVGCGILYALRRHRSAQQACWWMCLTCVVLTFRWVMFNSMFIA